MPDLDEREEMESAGFDADATPVDRFMANPDVGYRYTRGMSRFNYEE